MGQLLGSTESRVKQEGRWQEKRDGYRLRTIECTCFSGGTQGVLSLMNFSQHVLATLFWPHLQKWAQFHNYTWPQAERDKMGEKLTPLTGLLGRLNRQLQAKHS